MNQKLRAIYFVNLPLDFLSVGGGSIFVFFFLHAFKGHYSENSFLEISLTLLWFANWPHFSATLHRLYSSKSNIRQYPITTLGLPILIICLTVATLISPEKFASNWIKLYTLWAPYHFSGQTLGISLLYARRAGVTLTRFERLSLSGFIYGTFLVLVARTESAQWTQSILKVSYQSLAISWWVRPVMEIFMWSSGVFFAFLFLSRLFSTRPNFPVIFFVAPVAQFFWFILGPKLISFNSLVPFFHSVQYLPIVWFLSLREKKMGGAPIFVLKESWIWFRANLIGGAFLFWGIPHALAIFKYPISLAVPIVFAAINIHHFFVDGIIWKLRNPNVMSPLQGSVSDFLSSSVRSSNSLAKTTV